MNKANSPVERKMVSISRFEAEHYDEISDSDIRMHDTVIDRKGKGKYSSASKSRKYLTLIYDSI